LSIKHGSGEAGEVFLRVRCTACQVDEAGEYAFI